MTNKTRYTFAKRADFKIAGNLGIIGPGDTGFLHRNVIKSNYNTEDK